MRKFFTMTEENLWKEFCQRMADHNFWKSLYKKYPEESRNKYLQKYFLWIDRKFMFDKKEK